MLTYYGRGDPNTVLRSIGLETSDCDSFITFMEYFTNIATC